MNKIGLVIFILILLNIGVVSALRINEIEINPLDEGKEWVEFYNDEEEDVNISGWEIWEGVYGSSGPKKILSIENETIIPEGGFYVVEWNDGKLNNGGDFVILKDNNGGEIDETPLFKESSRSSKTYQLCNEEWKFEEETRDSENNCQTSTGNNNNSTNNNNPGGNGGGEVEEDDEEEEIEDEDGEIHQVKTLEKEVKEADTSPIVLGGNSENLEDSKSIKSSKTTDGAGGIELAKYSIVIFCVVLLFLYILKPKANKNEFKT